MTLTLHKKLDYLVCLSDQKDIKYITGNICLELSLKPWFIGKILKVPSKDVHLCAIKKTFGPPPNIAWTYFLLLSYIVSFYYESWIWSIESQDSLQIFKPLLYLRLNREIKNNQPKPQNATEKHQRICILWYYLFYGKEISATPLNRMQT